MTSEREYRTAFRRWPTFGPGLVTFLACHAQAQPKLLISQLNELISPFDFPSLALSINLLISKLKSRIIFGDAFCQLFALLIERAHFIFNYYLVKSKGMVYFVTFALPFATLILSNEYRGDNIPRLTVGPNLHPFVEF